MRGLPAALLFSSALLAQAPLSIDSITHELTGHTLFAPGSRALIRLTRTVTPQGAVAVQIGGKEAGIVAHAGERLYVVFPSDLPPGPTTVVAASGGVSTPPFPITLIPNAPVLATTCFWPGIYCPALAPSRTSLLAYGLGITDPVIPPGAITPKTPAPTVVKPVVMVAGRQAEVLSSALVPDRTNDGTYAIDFRLPPGTPDGTYPVTVHMGGQSSNTEMLRVAGAITKYDYGVLERPGAPESIMSLYACAAPLASGESIGDRRNPATELGGTTVRLKDSAGVERLAPMLYASPQQVNYVVPSGTALGDATVTISSSGGVTSTATVRIETTAPELFSVGTYFPAAVVVRVRNGIQTVEEIVRPTDVGTLGLVPIDLGPPDDRVYLLLFGTGLRGGVSNFRVAIGDVEAHVEYAGSQGEFAGLDQVNVALPRSLAGRGNEPLELRLIAGDTLVTAENTLYLAFR
jgi:uncharacterized protein (TIGR03437 family)